MTLAKDGETAYLTDVSTEETWSDHCVFSINLTKRNFRSRLSKIGIVKPVAPVMRPVSLSENNAELIEALMAASANGSTPTYRSLVKMYEQAVARMDSLEMAYKDRVGAVVECDVATIRAGDGYKMITTVALKIGSGGRAVRVIGIDEVGQDKPNPKRVRVSLTNENYQRWCDRMTIGSHSGKLPDATAKKPKRKSDRMLNSDVAAIGEVFP